MMHEHLTYINRQAGIRGDNLSLSRHMYIATSYNEVLHIPGIAKALTMMSRGNLECGVRVKRRRNTQTKTKTSAAAAAAAATRKVRLEAIMHAVSRASFNQAVVDAERIVAEAAAEYVDKLCLPR